MRRYFVIPLFIALISLSAQASAREQIHSFVSDITVMKNGTLDVTETITVNAEGLEIKHGIYRDIPVRALDDWGLWSGGGFGLRSITFDGKPSKYHTEWIDRFIRIYIGDADVFVPRGTHVYTIRYEMTGQLRSFDTYDEIYWNATGNFWSFPMLTAQARVHLPDGAVATQIAAYTGRFGAKGQDFQAVGQGSGNVIFTATRPLNAQEGLTVAVGFTKGVVPVSGGSGLIGLIFDNPGALAFVVGWIAFPIYLLFAWVRVGRDPPMETVIPLFHPPEDLSPPAMSYVHFKEFKSMGRGADLAFIAALLSLGVKRLLTIDEDGSDVVFKRNTEPKVPTDDLPHDEKVLFDRLFGVRDELAVTRSNGRTLQSAQSAMQSAIRSDYQDKFFRYNVGWFAPAVIIAAAAFVGGLFLQHPPDEAVGATRQTLIGSVIGWVLIVVGFRRYEALSWVFVNRVYGIILAAAGILAGSLAVYSAFQITQLLAYRTATIMIVIGIAILVLMFHLLRAPTLAGAKVLSRIEGFKLYLETAEANRLNLRDAPKMSEELFEKYLPYAAGLGVEEPWSEAYAAHLKRVAPNEDRTYQPIWYRGRDWSSHTIARSTAVAVVAISSAMASAMPQPKSSSGSSGGGSSGGGGGGGGGGGW